MASSTDLAARRDELKLETLYDLLVALHSHRSEQELLDELLQRVCSVVDPAAAAAVTRDLAGEMRAAALVGWESPAPSGNDLLQSALWRQLVAADGTLARAGGKLVRRPFRELRAVPLRYRDEIFGFLVVLDKEQRGGSGTTFTEGDQRFLESVAAVAGVAIDAVRQVEILRERSERLEQENRLLRARLVHEVAGQRIVGEAASMRHVLDIVDRVAPRGVNVLIQGESGTGKELVARLLHRLSERQGPLVAVNCAALPESLLESELFGIEGGVATGVQARIGKVELAHRGTLFLDEIGDLDVNLQVKLLRVLQEREVVRVGGHKATRVDIRLVTATHRSLDQLITEGLFRSDLFYRLKGVEISLPPLRERREDIPQLVRHFIERFCEREAIAIPTVSRDALALLLGHSYPGNVRELQNLVEGAAALADGRIEVELVSSLLGAGAQQPGGPEALDLHSAESRHIGRVLRLTGGNKSAAARLLGVDRRTLARKGF
jgi:transcriptional regulator with PAS, ATPase and Fis domain